MSYGKKVKGFYKKDGSTRPITQKAITTPMTNSKKGLTIAALRRRPARRIVTRKERSALATLENEMLFKNFVDKLKKLNPDEEIDIEDIDRHLEPHEAMMALKKKKPHVSVGLTADDQAAGFREFLDEFGITNRKVQNMIAMEDNPLSENELAQLSYVLNNRPDHALEVDKAKKAPVAENIRQYINHPNRTDIPGVDYAKKNNNVHKEH